MSCTREEARPSRNALVVDDEASIRTLLRAFLIQQGWACHIASDVGGALALLEREPFTHALVDLHLGKESGYDLIREIARRRPEIRIVAMTGSLLTSPDKGVPEGALAFLAKPFIALKNVLAALEESDRRAASPSKMDH